MHRLKAMLLRRTCCCSRKAVYETTIRTMSITIKGTKRLEGIDKNVWNEFTQLAVKHKALNVGQGFPDFSPPDHVKEALADAVNGPNHMFNQYTRGPGHPRLVNVLSKLFSPLMGREIDSMKHIIATAGAYGSLFCCFQAFIEEGDEVIIIEPFFDCYYPMTKMAGGTARFINLKPPKKSSDNRLISSNDWKLDEQELRSLFNKNTKAIVMNNPNNPLGKTYSREELEMIAKLCQEYNVLCLSDEVYEWLHYEDSKQVRIASLPGMWDRTITIGSAGKTFSVTGWKVGWAIGPENLVKHLVTVWQNSIFHCSTPAAEAVARGLEKELARFDSTDCYFKSLPRELQVKRDSVAKILVNAGFKPIIPNGGYFMMADTSGIDVDLSNSANSGERWDYRFVKWLTANKQLATMPTTAFYSSEHASIGEKYIRFCFCKEESTLEKMEDILRQWKK